MPESGEGIKSQGKDIPFGAGVAGGRTPNVVEGSVVRPGEHPLGGEDRGRSLVPRLGSARASSWFDEAMPHEELVSNIRGVVDRERARRHETTRKPFNPAEWLGEELLVIAGEHPEGEEHTRYKDLLTAWDALAYTRYTSGGGASKWSEAVREKLENRVQETNQTSLTLPSQSVKVLDAMAEVAGIPRKQGEATIDLSPFTQRDIWRQEDNWFEPEKPYENLVEDMRALVQQGRADYPETGTEPFNPAAWFGWYLQGLAEREEVSQRRYREVKIAWDRLAYTYYPTEAGAQRDRELARWQVEGYVSNTNQTSLTLPGESARVLDAMAEVAGIPRKRGEVEVDLTPFVLPNDNNQPPIPGK